jgi:PhzF family phenazine biosynthesis protein
MDLCGHATLAAGHIVLSELEPASDYVTFSSVSGPLKVSRKDGKYAMCLPLREPQHAELPAAIRDALNIQPLEVLKARDFVLVYDNQEDIANIIIDRPLFDKINLGTGGVIVTAPGVSCDFVSRYFTPQATILEDPVTGSAHCSLAPYWAKHMGQIYLHARQLSAQGGELHCSVQAETVEIVGAAQTSNRSHVTVN